MLVLTRKVGEAIEIPDLGITIRLLKSPRGKARLGIDAPEELEVYREEVLQKRGKEEVVPVSELKASYRAQEM